MAFGGPRSSCVRPGAHSARHQDSHKDWTPYRMAWPFVSAGAHAPHSDERLGPTATRGSSHSARRFTLPRFPVLILGKKVLILAKSPVVGEFPDNLLGPGSLEPVYEKALCIKLAER